MLAAEDVNGHRMQAEMGGGGGGGGGAEGSSPRVLAVLAFALERLVARNEGLVEDGETGAGGMRLKVFHGVRAPSISIPKYLERIYKYTNCSPSCFVVGYVYIDRLLHKHPDSLLVSLNVHRLIVTSVMVASKMLDDVHYNNAFFARVGGVSNAELNRMEMELLFMLDFGVVVSSRVFESYCLYLEKEMLWNGAPPHRMEKPIPPPASLDQLTEISVDDTHTSYSPPQIVD